MLVSGRNNVKEVLNLDRNNIVVKRVFLQKNFNENDILSLVKKWNLEVVYKEKYDLDRLVKNNHQGVVLEVGDFEYTDLEELLTKDRCFILILDHLEDPHNLGAITRTVEALGVDGIILPLNRSVMVNETVVKTSTGAIYNTKICQVSNLNNTIKQLKKNGFWIYGTDMNGVNYKEEKYSQKCAIVIGNEGNGLSRIVREACDSIISIPMVGKVNSLNASVAAGIVISEVINR